MFRPIRPKPLIPTLTLTRNLLQNPIRPEQKLTLVGPFILMNDLAPGQTARYTPAGVLPSHVLVL